jgi:hypothetical protein
MSAEVMSLEEAASELGIEVQTLRRYLCDPASHGAIVRTLAPVWVPRGSRRRLAGVSADSVRRYAAERAKLFSRRSRSIWLAVRQRGPARCPRCEALSQGLCADCQAELEGRPYWELRCPQPAVVSTWAWPSSVRLALAEP